MDGPAIERKSLAVIRCERKRRFLSERDAVAFLRASGNEGEPYNCRTCGGWHITNGHRSKRTASVNMASLYAKPGTEKRFRRKKKRISRRARRGEWRRSP